MPFANYLHQSPPRGPSASEGELTGSNKAGDELATSNATRGIKIKARNSSRQADGTIYIGVEAPSAVEGYVWCGMRASSDKVNGTDKKLLRLGEAVTIQSSRGKHRIVLTAIDRDSCTFDLVKD